MECSFRPIRMQIFCKLTDSLKLLRATFFLHYNKVLTRVKLDFYLLISLCDIKNYFVYTNLTSILQSPITTDLHVRCIF